MAYNAAETNAIVLSSGLERADSPVILFDGVCNLCNGAVNFIIDRDKSGRFKFASLQSPTGEALLQKYNRQELGLTTMVLVDEGRSYVRARAVLRIARHLGGIYSFAASLVSWLPTPVLDFAYKFLAARRYALFGKSDTCRVPTPELRSRFL